jgi:excisionase family DNA binding protein
MFEELPPFMTIAQAAAALQLGRSKTYELTVQWERSDGRVGLPFVRLGCQKRVPRAALTQFVEQALKTPA